LIDKGYGNLTKRRVMTAPASPVRKSIPDKRFALYGVAAGAALAAGASTAQANLVTLDLTGLNTTDRSTTSTGDLYFDVNAATASAAVSTTSAFAGADFHIFTGGPIPFGSFASISGLTANNGIAGHNVEIFKASNLTSSHLVGPMDTFGHAAVIASNEFAKFDPGDTGYLGLKFEIGSDIHYGWANITVGSDTNYPNVTLNALGYETNPDTPAHTEAPSSAPGVPDQGSTLALMALGAAGLAAARCRVRLARVTE
jgi:hypothetical protein